MRNKVLYILLISTVFGFVGNVKSQELADTNSLPFKIEPKETNPYGSQKPSSNINFKDPKNIGSEVEFDQDKNQYIIKQKVGGINNGVPYTMTFDEYVNYDINNSLKKYWRNRYRSETFENQSSIVPKINIRGQAFETIFGSNTIDIRPSGMVSLKFGAKIYFSDNPIIPKELRRQTTFDFKSTIQMSVVGKIGENLEMRVNFDTENQFTFDNKMKLAYQGQEDDIIQKIEVGNVSLPLSTSLITGSQSLMGVLTELKFGKLYVSSVLSKQQGETKTITVEGGAQKSEYDVSASKYDRNRHFFLSHYFRKNYDDFIKNVNQPTSPVVITKVEVWVTNRSKKREGARNIVAMLDIGEEVENYQLYDFEEKAIYDDLVNVNGSKFPDNGANDLYQKAVSLIAADGMSEQEYRSINYVSRNFQQAGMESGKQYEKVEYAERLQEGRDYTINKQLGYISLNSPVNDDKVLAVAFEYSVNGEIKKVGELSQDGIEGTDILIVKMLKGTNFSPNLPNWDLMMKNVYSIGAYQINRDDFMLDVEFYNDSKGTRVLNVPIPEAYSSLVPNETEIKRDKFVRLFNLDNLNSNGDYVSIGDGVFDFIEGITVLSSNGRIIFPKVEPFGGYIREKIKKDAQQINNVAARSEMEKIADKISYQELYDSTQYKAEQITTKNKYYLTGAYKSSGGSEIYLNSFNIPEGSVKVSAGGIILQENVDYTVDYNMGRVKILNESYLASGTPMKISLESQSSFGMQSKSLIGTHLEYRFNSDFNLGATIMRLSEMPISHKVRMGEEPISNTIWGLNGSYRTELPFLTKAVDFLPFIETKEKSTITVDGEFAQLMPGHSKAIGEAGNAFIDDFEGSESGITLLSRVKWVLSSTPQGQDLFPEASSFNGTEYGYNRAKLAWYNIDQSFFNSHSPVNADLQSNLKVYHADERDIFPSKESQSGMPTKIPTLDLAFYPEERGPYNYDDSVNSDGKLIAPQKRWGGIMRELNTNDFETQNIEYLMFWMMDPFVEDSENSSGGQLYFNFGNISEDILKDGRKSYEHGLPTTSDFDPNSIFETQWGRIPSFQPITDAFSNVIEERELQDVGLDGLNDDMEKVYFSDFLNRISSKVTNPKELAKIQTDPSSDNFLYWDEEEGYDEETSILQRYKNFSNLEGNSSRNNKIGISSPDVEDINRDYTLSETESYFQYTVNLNKNDMVVGRNYITDTRTAAVKFENGVKDEVKWYQFKIPLSEGVTIGNIQDFKSIRFARMFMRGWSEPIVLRFAKLELVRSEWRKYDYDIREGSELLGGSDESSDPSQIPFTVSSVNIEENGDKSPVNYVLPPGVKRTEDRATSQVIQQNEQAMNLRVIGLEDGYSKAVFKTLNMDMRDYGKLKMYIHAEALPEQTDLNDDDIRCFVRLGSDFTDNFYEYELPLKITAPGVYSDSETDRGLVWPEANNMEIIFDDLINAKTARNAEMRKEGSTLSFIDLYAHNSKGKRILIKGNPNIAQVKTIMIGIRNPKSKYNTLTNDDGNKKSAEIWVNELRLTDFDEQGGWAATGRITTRLADFGTVSFAGSTTQAGFGSIEQSAQERAKEETNQIDASANLEMGKFFPKEANVRVPMFLGYSRTAINPEYNPLDKDIKLENYLKDPSIPEAEKKETLQQVQDLTTRKSLNFTNVGLGKTGSGKTKFYSPSNLSASYSYSELNHHDVGIKYDITKDYMAGLNYIYNNRPKNIRPFKKSKLLRKKAFKIIGDFNFYYAPQQISIRTNINRRYNETLLRNLNNPDQVFNPTFDKNFTWNRQFDLKYNLSKSLKFDFGTNTNALIIEPEGIVDRTDEESYKIFKDSVWNSIRKLGTPNTYNHKFNVSYTIPINKLPFLDWVSSNARYTATYNWDRAKRTAEDLNVGNKIKNSRQLSLTNQFRMSNLYKKIDYFAKIDKKYKQSREQRKKPKFEDVTFKKSGIKFKKNTPRRINHNLGTKEEIRVKITTEKGTNVEAEHEVINDNKISVKLPEDAKGIIVEVTGKKEIKDNPFKVIMEHTVLAVTGFKQLSANYSLTQGTVVGNYRGNHNFTQLPVNPGLGFVFGWQNRNFGLDQANNNGLINDSSIVEPYLMTNNESWNFKANYQPVRSLRIDFTAKRIYSKNLSEYYKYDDLEGKYLGYDFQQKGSYSYSFWMLSSAFSKKPSLKDPESKPFNAYKEALIEQAWNLAQARGKAPQSYNNGVYDINDTENEYPKGYNSSNPDVAIPAFLKAYGNTGINGISDLFDLSSILKTLRPNWNVKYDGLKEFDLVKKYFKNISFQHRYTSTFTLGNYGTNVLYYNTEGAEEGWAVGDINKDIFISKLEVTSFSANEQFVPLIGVDLTWNNNILTKLEYKKTRNITMSLVNNQMTEVYTWEYLVGTGYRFDNLKFSIKTGGGSKQFKSDLNIRADIGLRNNMTVIYDLEEGTPARPTEGSSKVITMKFTADYKLSKSLTIQAYFDRNKTNPLVGGILTAQTEFGFIFRFSLSDLN